MTAPESMEAAAEDLLRNDPLGPLLDEYFEADALADAALEDVATYAQRARFSRQADVVEFALLNFRAYEGEMRRRHARHLLSLALCIGIYPHGPGRLRPGGGRRGFSRRLP